MNPTTPEREWSAQPDTPRERLRKLRERAQERLKAMPFDPDAPMGYQEPVGGAIDQAQERAFAQPDTQEKLTVRAALEEGK